MNKLAFLTLLLMIPLASCRQSVPDAHPRWTRNAVLYEMNTRQYSPTGTFREVEADLPHLAQAGVDILWFMPIQPIGKEGRKGPLGSYYSISDYCAINPEYGTMEDFRSCVNKAHELGMKVILDWVAGHTSRDAVWLSNESWYYRRPDGSPDFLFDWSDVARLNYGSAPMREAMLQAMLFWIKEVGLDGFRCDMAAECVPIDFWDWAIDSLRAVRPDIFMLAEGEEPSLVRKTFDAYYAWTFHHTLNRIAQGTNNVDDLRACLDTLQLRFGPAAIPLLFTSNHDENSWAGTEFERMGPAAEAMAALTFVLPGMPLVYTGQEVGNTKRLEFFVKDLPVPNRPDYYTQFYGDLAAFRKASPALAVPPYGGALELISTTDDRNVFCFMRRVAGNQVLGVFNLSASPRGFAFTQDKANGTYVPYNGEAPLAINEQYYWQLPAFGFQLFTLKN